MLLAFFRRVVRIIGPLGCVAVCVVTLLMVRNAIRSLKSGNLLGVRQISSIDTVVTGLREVSILKPYRVIVSGFSRTNIVDEAGKRASLEFQYKGFAEYEIDLSKIMVSQDDNGLLVISIDEPKMGKPNRLNVNGERLWKVKTDWGMGEWKAKFRNLFTGPDGIETRILTEKAHSPKHLARAKSQAEKVLRYMFAPAVNDPERDIVFSWRNGGMLNED